MASPFEYFRKNQRTWMAGAVLVAIGSFVIAPMLEQFMGSSGSGGGPNPVVASWNGGSIRLQQLRKDQEDLALVNRFLRDLATTVMNKGGMPSVPNFSADLSSVGVTPAGNVDAIIERNLFQTEAKRQGIVFDESAVHLFLTRFADGRVSGNEIQQIMRKATDRRLSMPLFSRVLKDELTYHELRRLITSGLAFTEIRDSRVASIPVLSTPSKNWREYLKISQNAKIRAYPVNVRDQLENVTTAPTDTQLRALYETGKNTVRTPDTLESTAAFMRPATAEIEYLSLDIEKFVAEEMAKLPEDKIRDEYETRVLAGQYKVPVEIPATDAPATEAPATEAPATEAPATEAPATEAPATEAPATEAPATEAPATEAPATEAPATEAPATEAPATEADPQSNLIRGNSTIRLVSYQDETPATETPATETPATETPATETPATETPATEAPATEAPATEAPATEAPATEAPATEAPATGTSLSIGEAAPQNADLNLPAVAPMRTQTFDEVKDQLARELAMTAAIERADEQVSLAYDLLRVYQSELNTYQASSRQPGAVQIPEPTRPNFDELAKEYGFEYGQTGKVDSQSLANTPLGGTTLLLGRQAGRQTIATEAIVDATVEIGDVYVPLLATAQRGDSAVRFIFWKTALERPQTPSFDSVKADVENVWKYQEAQKLAEAKAKDLASKVGSGQIADVLTSDEEKLKIADPAPFTAINRMFALFPQFNMSQGNEVSQIDALQPVDMNFMDAVFAAKPGETFVAPDQRRSVYYVVQLVETTPSLENLLEEFHTTPKEAVSALVARENNALIDDYRQSIYQRLGFRLYDVPGLQ